MILAAPEFVVAEFVEMLDQIQIAPELQHRMLADRVMRGEEGAKIQSRHDGSPETVRGCTSQTGLGSLRARGDGADGLKDRGFRPEPRPGGSASWTSAKGSGPWNPLMGLFSGEGLHGRCQVAVGPPLRTNPIDRLQRASPFAGGPGGTAPAGFQGGALPFAGLRRGCFDGKHVVS